MSPRSSEVVADGAGIGGRRPVPVKRAARPSAYEGEVDDHPDVDGGQGQDGAGGEAEEGRHLVVHRFADRLHHEVRSVADVGVGAHEHGGRADRDEEDLRQGAFGQGDHRD